MVEAFRPEHLLELDPQVGKELCTLEYGQLLAERGPAITLRDRGVMLLCGGIAMFHVEQENWLWSFLSKAAQRRMLVAHRTAKQFLADHPMELLASTTKGFLPGCRWLSMLGFELHGEDRIYGAEHFVYRRVACQGR